MISLAMSAEAVAEDGWDTIFLIERILAGGLRNYLPPEHRNPGHLSVSVEELERCYSSFAGMTYLAVFAIYLTLIVTGVALYSVSADSYMAWFQWLLPILGGPQTARWIHHIAMWFLLGFVAHHIWSAMLVSRIEGMGLIDSLFSGYKFLPRSWRDRDE